MTPEIGTNLSVNAFVEPSIDHLNSAKLGRKLDNQKILYHF